MICLLKPFWVKHHLWTVSYTHLNMTNKELVLNMLAELSTKEISESKNPETFREHMDVAEAGGEIARNARMELEAKTGKAVISPLNAKTGIALNSSPEEEEDTKE